MGKISDFPRGGTEECENWPFFSWVFLGRNGQNFRKLPPFWGGGGVFRPRCNEVGHCVMQWGGSPFRTKVNSDHTVIKVSRGQALIAAHYIVWLAIVVRNAMRGVSRFRRNAMRGVKWRIKAKIWPYCHQSVTWSGIDCGTLYGLFLVWLRNAMRGVSRFRREGISVPFYILI